MFDFILLGATLVFFVLSFGIIHFYDLLSRSE